MVADAEWCIEKIQDSNVLDSALISAAQSVEHYEMAMYGSAAAWAKVMELPDVQKILGTTLEEEKQADEILNKAALKINKLAYEETRDTEEDESRGFMGVGKMQTGNI
jgi:ferritin-like metal-binding protein YciE